MLNKVLLSTAALIMIAAGVGSAQEQGQENVAPTTQHYQRHRKVHQHRRTAVRSTSPMLSPNPSLAPAPRLSSPPRLAPAPMLSPVPNVTSAPGTHASTSRSSTPDMTHPHMPRPGSAAAHHPMPSFRRRSHWLQDFDIEPPGQLPPSVTSTTPMVEPAPPTPPPATNQPPVYSIPTYQVPTYTIPTYP